MYMYMHTTQIIVVKNKLMKSEAKDRLFIKLYILTEQ